MHRILFPLAAPLSLFSPSILGATLTVAVAANVQYAFGDLQAEFKNATGHDLKPVYGSSGKLTAQIMNGAPFDAFLSLQRWQSTLAAPGMGKVAVADPKTAPYGREKMKVLARYKRDEALKGQEKWIELPQDDYQPIAQGVVVLKHGQRIQHQVAQQFHDFVLSPKSRAILERNGYLLP